jgi:nitrogen regulatory protein PII
VARPSEEIAMREIKAYVRPGLLETIIKRLEDAGAKDLTVIRVDALGALVDYEAERTHLFRKYAEKYGKIAKVEIVCRDDQAGPFAQIIREAGHLGESGDGRIFITTIEAAINIRTGSEGEDAL